MSTESSWLFRKTTIAGISIRGLWLVLGLTVLVFVIASNIAWLNPRPDFAIYRTIDAYPFMWQYNADAGMEIVSAAYFPHGFRTYPQRINRPLYPVVAWSIGQVIGLLAAPFTDLSELERAGAGYIVMKLAVHIGAALLLVDLLRRKISDRATMLVVAVVLLHPHSIAHIATFHTTELQVLVPIVVLWLLARIGDTETNDGTGRKYWRQVVSYTLITSVLMMGKQNFAIYAAILVWALTLRRWREVAVSVAVFLLPVALYAGFLRLFGLSYRNNEIAAMGQGVWVFELLTSGPITVWQELSGLFLRFIINGVRFWGIWLVFGLIALGDPQMPLRRREIGLLLLFAGATWAQYVAVRRFDVAYLVGDISVYVYGLAAWLLVDRWGIGADRLQRQTDAWWVRLAAKRATLTTFIALFGLASVLSFVTLPWLSPWEQPYRDQDYLEDRQEVIEFHAEQ